MKAEDIDGAEPRYIVIPVSVGDPRAASRPGVFDRVEQRLIKTYRLAEQALAEQHAERLNEASEGAR